MNSNEKRYKSKFVGWSGKEEGTTIKKYIEFKESANFGKELIEYLLKFDSLISCGANGCSYLNEIDQRILKINNVTNIRNININTFNHENKITQLVSLIPGNIGPKFYSYHEIEKTKFLIQDEKVKVNYNLYIIEMEKLDLLFENLFSNYKTFLYFNKLKFDDHDIEIIKKYFKKIFEMVRTLNIHGISHGDIHSGNIMIKFKDKTYLKLVQISDMKKIKGTPTAKEWKKDFWIGKIFDGEGFEIKFIDFGRSRINFQVKGDEYKFNYYETRPVVDLFACTNYDSLLKFFERMQKYCHEDNKKEINEYENDFEKINLYKLIDSMKFEKLKISETETKNESNIETILKLIYNKETKYTDYKYCSMFLLGFYNIILAIN